MASSCGHPRVLEQLCHQTRLWGKGGAGTSTHLAGADGTFDEAKGGHNRVPAGARASPCLVPIEVAAWERKRRNMKKGWAQLSWRCQGGQRGTAVPSAHAC